MNRHIKAPSTHNVTVLKRLSIDTTAPNAPTVAALGSTNDTTPTITGVAEANSTVKVYEGSTLLGTTTADGNGAWSFTPTSALGQGAYSVTATATDAAGNVSVASGAQSLVIDTTAPTVSSVSITSATGLQNSTLNAGDVVSVTVTMSEATTVTGTPQLALNIGGATVQANYASGSGTTALVFTYTIVSGETDANGISVDANGLSLNSGTLRDAAGNDATLTFAAVSDNAGYLVDTTAPSAPTVAALGSTNDTTPTITGVAEANSTVKVYAGSTLLGTTTANGNGAWSFTPTSALGQGTYSVTATAMDAAGNASVASGAQSLVIDTTAPSAPTVAALGSTNDTTPTITGVAEANSTVNVYAGSTLLGTTTADGNGAWSFTPTSALGQGAYSVTATATDAAGNASVASGAQSLVIDSSAPTATFVAPADAATGIGINGALTVQFSKTVTGIGTGNVLIKTVTGDITVATLNAADASISGTGASTQATLAYSGLSAGTAYYVVLNAGSFVDLAGNSYAGTSNIGAAGWDFTTADPAIGVNTLAGDNRVNIAENGATVTISGTISSTTASVLQTYDAAHITVSLSGASSVTAGSVTYNNSTGVWTATVPANTLINGDYTVNVSAISQSGGTPDLSSSKALVVDLTAPSAPTVAALGSTNDTTPTITGVAEANSTVKVYEGSTLLGTTTADGNGAWSFTPTSALGQGAYSVTATATDAAGNTSGASGAQSLVIDTTAPNAPTVAALGSTNDTTPTITGAAEANSTVKVYEGSTLLGTTTANGSGAWSFTPPSALSPGAYSVTATATDAAGNTSGASSAQSLVIDTTAPNAPTVAALGSTNDTTPTITGTAEANSTVKVYAGSTLLGTTTADGNGAWSFTPTSALGQGAYSVTATATDAAGNVSVASGAQSLVIDTTAPSAPTVAALGSTNDTTPTITGVAEANSTVKVYEGSTLLGTTTADSNGAWSFTPTSALSQGAYSVTATATDAAGNVSVASSAQSLVIDTTPPNAPTVAALGSTNDTTPTITGTAEANSTVKVYAGSTLLGTTTADGNGAWSFTPPSALGQGTYSVTATATDAAGNVSVASSAQSLVIDTTAPSAPTVDALGSTNDTTPTITGAAEANSTVKVYEGSTLLGTTTADGNGAWSFTPTSALGQGAYSVTATATDAAGNVSVASSAQSLVIDTTAPNAPTVAALGSTNDTTPTITGAAEANSTVKVYAGSTLLGTTTANSSGAWSFTPTSALGQGTYSVTATATDAAGNVSVASGAQSLVIDTTAPNAPTVAALGSTNDTTPTITGVAEANSTVKVYAGSTLLGTTTANGNGAWSFTPTSALGQGTYSVTATAMDAAGNASVASGAQSLVIDTTAPSAPTVAALGSTNDTTPTITGVAEANSTVNVYAGSTLLGTTTADGNGAWSFTPTSALGQGAYSVTATATDAAGNVSVASGAQSLVIDTSAPTATFVAPADAATGIGINGALTVQFSKTVTGIGTGNVLIKTVTGDSTVATLNAADASISGTGASTQATLAYSGLSAGTAYYVVLNAGSFVDLAGNSYAGTSNIGAAGWDFTTADPAIGVNTLAGDNRVNIAENGATVTISGTISSTTASVLQTYDAAHITVSLSGASSVTAGSVTYNNSTGVWTATVPANTLINGDYTVNVSAISQSGGTPDLSSSKALVVDLTAPSAPTVAALGSTNDTTPTITGVAEANSTVKVYEGSTLLGTTTADGNGAWSFTPTSALGQGAYSVTATATDAAGNVSVASSAQSLVIDTTAPSAPTVAALGSTNDTTPTITGAAEANSTVKVYEGSTLLGTTTANGSGAWSFTPTNPLSEGAYSVTATATDAAGNTSGASSAQSLVIDTTAPSAPAVNSSLTNDTTPTITGVAEANSTVKVYAGSTLLGTTTADGNGAWSFTPTSALGQGAYSVTATATDAAGNVSVASSAQSLVIDTTAPSAPTVDALGSTNDTTPTITGVAEANSTVKVYADLTLLGTTTADGNGAWSFTPTSALGQGTYSVTATATDAVGNVSVASGAQSLVIDTTAPSVPTAITISPSGGVVVANTLNGTNTSMDLSATITAGQATGGRADFYINGVLIGSDTNIAAGDTSVSWSSSDGTPTAAELQMAITAGGVVTVALSDALGNTVTGAGPTLLRDIVAPYTMLDLVAAIANGAPANAALANDGVVTVTGEAGSALTLTFSHGGNSVVKTLVASGSPQTVALSGTDLLILGDGNIVVSATQTDVAGNTSAAVSASFTLDGIAPVAPALALGAGVSDGATQAEATANTGVVTVTGEVGATISVTFSDGAHTVTKTVTGNGGTPVPVVLTASDLGGVSGLTDGSINVSATQTDAAGNPQTGAAVTTSFMLDTSAPSAPTLTLGMGVSDGATQAEATANTGVVTVTGEVGATITVTFSDGAHTITKTVTGNGSAPVPVVLAAAELGGASGLANGSISVSATQRDLAGNAGATASTSFILDTTPPATPMLMSFALFNEPVSPTVDPITTNDATPLIRGTAAAGASLTMTLAGATYTTTADGNGFWAVDTGTASHTGALGISADGDYTISLSSTDTAGNTATATGTLTLDRSGPANAPSGLTITPSGGAVFANTMTASTTALDFRATIVAGQATGGYAEFYIDGQLIGVDTDIQAGDTAVFFTTSDGTPTAAELQALVTAGGVLTVKLFDASGNSTVSGNGPTLIRDITPPAAPTDITVTLNGGTASPGMLNGTNTDASLSATVVAGQATGGRADFYINGVLIGSDTNIAAGDSSVSYSTSDGTPTAAELQAAIPSAGNVTVKLFDAVGNEVTGTGPYLQRSVATIGTPTINNARTNGSNPVITGTATLNAGEKLYVDFGYNGYVFTPGDGYLTLVGSNWSLNPMGMVGYGTPFDALQLAGRFTGGNTITAYIRNGALSGPTASGTVVYENQAPTATFVAPADAATGIGINGALTVQFSETVTAAGASNVLIKKVSDNSTVVTLNAADASISGTGASTQATLAYSGLSAGTAYYVVLNAGSFVDLAGNNYVGTSGVGASGWDFTTANPAIGVNTLAGDNRVNIAENGATVTISGTISSSTSSVLQNYDAAHITVSLSGASSVTAGSVTYDNSTGVWTATVPANTLINGDYTVNVSAISQSGGTPNLSSSKALRVDLSAPAAPTLTLGTGVSDGATQAEATAATGVVQVTGEAGASIAVTFSDGTHTVTKTVTGNGSTPVPVVLTAGDLGGSGLANGAITVSAVATDVAGNAGAAATTNFTLDTSGPAAPTLTGLVTNDTTPILTGTAEANATVKVTVGGVTFQVTADSAGRWAVDTTPVTGSPIVSGGSFSLGFDGSKTVTLQAVDAAGNAGSAATASFTLDTTAPTATFIAPADGALPAAGIGISGNLVLSFSETVSGAGTGNIQIRRFSDNVIVATLSGQSASISGTGSSTQASVAYTGLTANTHYVVTLDAGAFVDTAGNAWGGAGALGASGWDFTTMDPAIGLNAIAGDNRIDIAENAAVISLSGSISASNTSVRAYYDAAHISVTLTPTSGNVVTATVTGYDSGAGVWTATVPSDTLVNGSYTVAVTATSQNVATPNLNASQTLTVDLSAPAAPVLALGVGVADGATQAEATATTGVVTVTGEVGATITVTFSDGAHTITKTVTGNGSTPVPVVLAAAELGGASGLANGPITVSATQRDLAGNAPAAAAALAFTLDTLAAAPADTTPPAAPVFSDILKDPGGISVVFNPALGNKTTDQTPYFFGTAEALSTVTLWRMVGSTPTNWATTTADAAGNWSYQAPTLSNGTYLIKLTATDAAGNQSTFTSAKGVWVDTTFSGTTTDTTPPALLPSGAVALDASGSNATLTVKFNEPLATTNLPPTSAFTVTDGSGNAVTVTGISVSGTVATLTLSGAPKQVMVTYADPTAGNDVAALQDAAGNDVSTFTQTASYVFVDVPKPSYTILANNTYVVSGTASPGAIISASLPNSGNALWGGPMLPVRADANGNWTMTVAAAGETADFTVNFTANSNGSISKVDSATMSPTHPSPTLLPPVSAVDIVSMTLDTGVSSNDWLTNVSSGHTLTGSYTGTLNWGDVIQVLVTQTNPQTQNLSSEWALTAAGTVGMLPGSQKVFNAVADGNGHWTLANVTLLPSDSLSSGAGYIVARIFNESLNTAGVQDVQAYTVDHSAPTLNYLSSVNLTATNGGIFLKPSGGVGVTWLNAGDTITFQAETKSSSGMSYISEPVYSNNSGAYSQLGSFTALGLTLNDSTSSTVDTRSANFTSGGTPSSTITFTYTVQQGDNTTQGNTGLLAGYTNGVAINANGITTSGGSIIDAAGNELNITFSSAGGNIAYGIDTVAANVSVVDRWVVGRNSQGNYDLLHRVAGEDYIYTRNTSISWNSSEGDTTGYLIDAGTSITSAADISALTDNTKKFSTVVGPQSVNTGTFGGSFNLADSNLANGDYKFYALDKAGNLTTTSTVIHVTPVPTIISYRLIDTDKSIGSIVAGDYVANFSPTAGDLGVVVKFNTNVSLVGSTSISLHDGDINGSPLLTAENYVGSLYGTNYLEYGDASWWADQISHNSMPALNQAFVDSQAARGLLSDGWNLAAPSKKLGFYPSIGFTSSNDEALRQAYGLAADEVLFLQTPNQNVKMNANASTLLITSGETFYFNPRTPLTAGQTLMWSGDNYLFQRITNYDKVKQSYYLAGTAWTGSNYGTLYLRIKNADGTVADQYQLNANEVTWSEAGLLSNPGAIIATVGGGAVDPSVSRAQVLDGIKYITGATSDVNAGPDVSVYSDASLTTLATTVNNDQSKAHTVYVDAGAAAGLGTNGVFAGQYVAVVTAGLIDPARDTGSALLHKLFDTLLPRNVSLAEAVATVNGAETHYKAALSLVGMDAGAAEVFLFDGNGNIRKLSQQLTIVDDTVAAIVVNGGADALITTDGGVPIQVGASGVNSSYVYLVDSGSSAISGGVLNLQALKALPASSWNVSFVDSANLTISADGLAPGVYSAFILDSGQNQAKAVNAVTVNPGSPVHTSQANLVDVVDVVASRNLGSLTVDSVYSGASESLTTTASDISYTHSVVTSSGNYNHIFSGELTHNNPHIVPGMEMYVNLSFAASVVKYKVIVASDYTWSLDTRTASPLTGMYAPKYAETVSIARVLEEKFSYEPTTTGSQNYQVTFTDQYGNSVTRTGSFSYDLVNPLAYPTLDALITNDLTPVLNGSAAPSSTFSLVVGGATFTVTAGSNGRWSLDTQTATPSSGSFALSGSQSVNGGAIPVQFITSSGTANTSFTLDVVAPSANNFTIDNYVTNTTGTWWYYSQNQSYYRFETDNRGTGLVTGHGNPGDVVEINGSKAVVQADGTWGLVFGLGYLSYPAPADGSAAVSATVTDQAGNSFAMPSSIAYTVSAPEVTLSTDSGHYYVEAPQLNSAFITNPSNLHITWNYINNNYIKNTPSTSPTMYSINGGVFEAGDSIGDLTASLRAQLHAGQNDIVVKRPVNITDSNNFVTMGNIIGTAEERYNFKVYLDNTYARSSAVQLSPIDANQLTPIFSGYSEPFSTVGLNIGSANLSAMADASGHWSIAVADTAAGQYEMSLLSGKIINAGGVTSGTGDPHVNIDLLGHNLSIGDVLNVYGWGIESDAAHRQLLASYGVNQFNVDNNSPQIAVDLTGISTQGQVYVAIEALHAGPSGAAVVQPTSQPFLYLVAPQ